MRGGAFWYAIVTDNVSNLLYRLESGSLKNSVILPLPFRDAPESSFKAIARICPIQYVTDLTLRPFRYFLPFVNCRSNRTSSARTVSISDVIEKEQLFNMLQTFNIFLGQSSFRSALQLLTSESQWIRQRKARGIRTLLCSYATSKCSQLDLKFRIGLL